MRYPLGKSGKNIVIVYLGDRNEEFVLAFEELGTVMVSCPVPAEKKPAAAP